MMHGLLVIDKPLGITSRAALDRAARWFPRRTRIGHAGTLDPLATGVLVLCIGHATRLTDYVHAMSKVYDCEFTLGAYSATDDAEGPIVPVAGAVAPEQSAVEQACAALIGDIEQIPPDYSAAKSSGRRAYAAARRGETVSLRPRIVRVDRLDVLGFDYPTVTARVECGKGTYIRSLARDLGRRLGCGAFVSRLRRMRIGPFTVESACRLDASADNALRQVLPPIQALSGLPVLVASADDEARIRNGRRIGFAHGTEGSAVALIDQAHGLIGVGQVVGGEIQPTCVLPAGG